MRIAIASDHAGFVLKESVRRYLEEKGFDVTDYGAFTEERTDYPDFGKKVAHAVKSGEVDRGVLVCGSAIGMCIVANRFKGVRAAVLRDEYDAEMSRRHNDANVACFGGRVTEFTEVKNLVDTFLSTGFEGGRHEVRVKKIDE